jgi:AraC-like DNA-binding protein
VTVFPAPTDSLDRALAALEWRMIAAHRDKIDAGGMVCRPHSAAGFLFVGRGSVQFAVADLAPLDLVAGDLVYFPAAHDVSLHTPDGADVIDIELAATASLQHVADALPSTLIVRGFAQREPLMVALIDGLDCAGLCGARPGDGVIYGRIATTVVSVALRSWSEMGCATQRWLNRVDDPFIARAVDAMHADPGRSWTLEALARLAAMSRSAFAERFRAAVDRTPLGYLAELRMEAAKRMLVRGDESVAEIASTLGYASEDGFSRAFRRHTGSAPSRWRVAA